MRIQAIEPTPSPNTMKILLDEELPSGTRHNYKPDNIDQAPPLIQALMRIDGVKGIYHVADFFGY